jgi:hypothetical protein
MEEIEAPDGAMDRQPELRVERFFQLRVDAREEHRDRKVERERASRKRRDLLHRRRFRDVIDDDRLAARIGEPVDVDGRLEPAANAVVVEPGPREW